MYYFLQAMYYYFLLFFFSILSKNAKEILCDPDKRILYDKWRHSGISISYKQWMGMKEHVQQVSIYKLIMLNIISITLIFLSVNIFYFNWPHYMIEIKKKKSKVIFIIFIVNLFSSIHVPLLFFFFLFVFIRTYQSMHWSTPKTKDRMLPDASGPGGSPGHVRGQPANAHRRASEGGANIHYGARRDLNWDSQASSDVVNKFRNYEI